MTDAPVLTRQPETEKAEEPPKRWKNRYLVRCDLFLNPCPDCSCGFVSRSYDAGEEYLGCRTYGSAEEARADRGFDPDQKYLGPVPVSP